MDRPVITKANFDTLAGKIEDYNSFNDSLALAEIQHRAKELFDKEIPLEILQGENHHQEFCGWLMREVNPVIEFDDGTKREFRENPLPETNGNPHKYILPIIKPQRKFYYEEIPDGVGFETDKGIFTYDGNLDNFYNNKTGKFADESDNKSTISYFDEALNFASRYGDVQQAIQSVDYGYYAEDVKKLNRRYPVVVKEVIESIEDSDKIVADKIKEFLQDNAKDWTLVFDVDNDGTKILRGADAEKAIQKKIATGRKSQARFDAIQKIDLNAKPKTNAEKLQQFCKKAAALHIEDFEKGKRPRITEDYMAGGVELFLLSTPNIKLEQMTKLIDAVAPMAAYNSTDYKYSDILKEKVKSDKKFQTQLAANKNSVQKGR